MGLMSVFIIAFNWKYPTVLSHPTLLNTTFHGV